MFDGSFGCVVGCGGPNEIPVSGGFKVTANSGLTVHESYLGAAGRVLTVRNTSDEPLNYTVYVYCLPT